MDKVFEKLWNVQRVDFLEYNGLVVYSDFVTYYDSVYFCKEPFDTNF